MNTTIVKKISDEYIFTSNLPKKKKSNLKILFCQLIFYTIFFKFILNFPLTELDRISE